MARYLKLNDYHKLRIADASNHGYWGNNESDDERTIPVMRNSSSSCNHFLTILLLVQLLMISFISFLCFQSEAEPHPPKGRLAQVKPLDVDWKRFFWHSKYSPRNHTMSDGLWENILPSHGFVAIDRQEAAKNGYPESMYLPSDHSKAVYLLEAYHQLHCLRILRLTFWEAVEGRSYTYDPSSHVEHCFDALRQAVICNADNLPLYTFGDRTAGDGQMHKCRSWEQLRDYATANSACYRDSVVDIPLGEHFGYCDDGDDGVLDFSGP